MKSPRAEWRALPLLIGASLFFSQNALLAEDGLARLVADLGSDDYATREKATVKLLASGEPARALLEKARDSADAEVSLRAKKILAVLDARREVDTEYEAARKTFDGKSAADAARRVWLEVLSRIAGERRDGLGNLFASGVAPDALWESARGCPLRVLVDVRWVEVIPSKRLGWIGVEMQRDEVLVMGAIPESDPHEDAGMTDYRMEPRALLLSPRGDSWVVQREAPADLLQRAQSVEGGEAGVGAMTVLALWSRERGGWDYDLAQALDAVGDWEGAIRSFARCQPTGRWPDYCIVHRHFDLMRLGRKEEARRALDEKPGPGSCEYLGRVIGFLKGETTRDALLAWTATQGSYVAESVHYYLGMERLLAGDEKAAKESLGRCADRASGCYEQTFARDALGLIGAPNVETPVAGEAH